MENILSYVIITFCAYLVFVVGEKIYYKINSLKRELKHYRETYLWKSGYLIGYGNYRLISIDSGKSWYATEGFHDNVKILGDVEEVYPGLMTSLKAWDDLTNYALKNGPIDVGSMSDGESSILKNAGFLIEQK